MFNASWNHIDRYWNLLNKGNQLSINLSATNHTINLLLKFIFMIRWSKCWTKSFSNQTTTNFPMVQIHNYRDVRHIYDSLLCLKHHKEEAYYYDRDYYDYDNYQDNDDYIGQAFNGHLSLSSNNRYQRASCWCTDEQYETLKKIFEMSFRFDYTGFIEPELTRLRAGLLLMEIFNKLDPTIPAGSTQEEQKKIIFYYSAHDATMFHLLYALGHCPGKSLKFGATMVFEASRDSECNQTMVRISLMESSGSRANDHPWTTKRLFFRSSSSLSFFSLLFISNQTATTYSSLEDVDDDNDPRSWISLTELKRQFASIMVSSVEQWTDECSNLNGLDPSLLKRFEEEN